MTRPSDLKDLHSPKVYRFGSWQVLPRIHDIEEALAAAEAEIVDLPG
ncbi:MAG TPA: hypothetical protein VFD58_23335 [Blastocatellia bacterium]|nr:hypothetical protein [Blastocatellia bacterium]